MQVNKLPRIFIILIVCCCVQIESNQEKFNSTENSLSNPTSYHRIAF